MIGFQGLVRGQGHVHWEIKTFSFDPLNSIVQLF